MTPERGITSHTGFTDRLMPEGYGLDYSQLENKVFEQLKTAGFEGQDMDLFRKTVCFVRDCFVGTRHEVRHSGDHVMVHFLSMANEYLADGGKDTDLVLTMLLHDTLEDTVDPNDEVAQEAFVQELSTLAGERVAKMVVALTKIRSANLDGGLYVDFGASQHETNLKLIMTLFDESGEVTKDSLQFARDVWLVKSYDIRHNLRTLDHHRDRDSGEPNMAKQISKARLALNYQAPVMYGLGLVREARVIEDLALPVVAQSLVTRNQNLLDILYGAEYMDQVAKWWGEFALQENLDEDLSHIFDLPRLQEVLTDFPRIRLYIESDELAAKIWSSLGQGHPRDDLDVQANFTGADYPWQKVVLLENRQKILVEIHSAKTRVNRDGQIIGFVQQRLDHTDPASYMRLASEFMSQHRRVEAVKFLDQYGNEQLINKGARWLDYVFSVSGIEGLLKATRVVANRSGKMVEIDLGEYVLAGDQITAVEYGDSVHEPLLKLDKLSVRYTSGGWESLRQWLGENMESVDIKEIRTRGYKIFGWLYRQVRGKDIDIFPQQVFDDEESYVSFMENLGRVNYRASDQGDYDFWRETAAPYGQSGIVGEQDKIVIEAFARVDELIELRESLPVVTIQMTDQPNVISAIGEILKGLGISTIPFRGEMAFDPESPTETPAHIEIVLGQNDRDKLAAFQAQIAQQIPGAEVVIKDPSLS